MIKGIVARFGRSEHRPGRHVRRDQDRRHARSKQVEIEEILAVKSVRVDRAPGRRNMVVGAPMLVERNNQQRVMPIRAVAHSLVDLLQKLFPAIRRRAGRMIIRPLVEGKNGCPFRFQIAKLGQRACLGMTEELRKRRHLVVLLRSLYLRKGIGGIALIALPFPLIVNAPALFRLCQIIEDGRYIELLHRVDVLIAGASD
ncbi:hypothetical protein BG61_10885 [Caballeronia glathei]|uniref:Uncharacterized protein n=1 Tax=Caballeronia glathei TaxID=60547 RepID=A0A069PAX9_9BURK|nr:hypothetical protein BG61_10885 [Caballeronia glathei]